MPYLERRLAVAATTTGASQRRFHGLLDMPVEVCSRAPTVYVITCTVWIVTSGELVFLYREGGLALLLQRRRDVILPFANPWIRYRTRLAWGDCFYGEGSASI